VWEHQFALASLILRCCARVCRYRNALIFRIRLASLQVGTSGRYPVIFLLGRHSRGSFLLSLSLHPVTNRWTISYTQWKRQFPSFRWACDSRAEQLYVRHMGITPCFRYFLKGRCPDKLVLSEANNCLNVSKCGSKDNFDQIRGGSALHGALNWEDCQISIFRVIIIIEKH